MMLCEGIYCSSYASTVGSPQYIYAHTCARLRFAFTASSGTTVYGVRPRDRDPKQSHVRHALPLPYPNPAPCRGRAA